MRQLTYNLAPKKKGEKDSNLSRMRRWEEAQGMNLKELTDEEWVDVVRSILCLTESEAWAYLEHLRASNM